MKIFGIVLFVLGGLGALTALISMLLPILGILTKDAIITPAISGIMVFTGFSMLGVIVYFTD